MPAPRRPPRARSSRSSGGSDLMMRILVAVPAAIAVVIFLLAIAFIITYVARTMRDVDV